MVLKEGDLRAQHPYGIAPAGFRLPDRTRVGAVHLQIGDLDRSVDYYREIIGLQVFERTVDGAILGARGTDLPLVRLHAREGTRPVTRGGTYGLYHFAILLPDRAALGRLASHLSETGVRVGMADHLVSESLYLTDPDGLGIEVYADRPRNTWRHHGPELAMATDPLDLSSVVAAGVGHNWDGAPPGTTMGHMHLHVGSLDAAEAFYHRGLGFDKTVWSYPGALFFSAGGYHHHLGTEHLVARAIPNRGSRPAPRVGAHRAGSRRRISGRAQPSGCWIRSRGWNQRRDDLGSVGIAGAHPGGVGSHTPREQKTNLRSRWRRLRIHTTTSRCRSRIRITCRAITKAIERRISMVRPVILLLRRQSRCKFGARRTRSTRQTHRPLSGDVPAEILGHAAALDSHAEERGLSIPTADSFQAIPGHAVEAGDVVLVRSDPRDVPRIIALSKATYRKMIQNLWWAAGYNIVAIPLAAGVLAPWGIVLYPAVGAVLMSLSTVVVAINAQLLRGVRL